MGIIISERNAVVVSPINQAVMKLKLRAERSSREQLISTFVDIDPLLMLLKSEDHQILYGRRGTGKTHALEYLANSVIEDGNIAVAIDMRTIGSNGGIYNDQNIPLSQRATRLLVDTLQAIHEQVLTAVVELDSEYDLSVIGPILDNFLDSASQVAVVGTVSSEHSSESQSTSSNKVGLNVSAKTAPGLTFTAGYEEGDGRKEAFRRGVSGVEQNRIHFGTLHRSLVSLCTKLASRRLWVILDEWSEVPLDLQPYLADLFRRSLMPASQVTLKIGAIEQRTNFRVDDSNGGYIGVEVGADITANTNLDDFMVFDNDQVRASGFFENFIHKHLVGNLPDNFLTSANPSRELLQQMFTQSSNAFGEFVRASEGVPRDAINILNIAAQHALDDPISIPNIRVAAKKWFQLGKEQTVQNHRAKALLRWVIDEVIAHRQARAFLLRSDSRHELIESLFDARILHIVKKGVSSNDTPGVRYDVYSIDYGCYVDLMNTARAPKGLFDVSNTEDAEDFVEVPVNDYRSIRRAILNLEKFEEAQST